MTLRHLRSKKGTTLLELIIVIGILSIVVAAIYTVLLFGNRLFVAGNRQFAVQSDARLAMDQIVKELRYAKELTLLAVDIAEMEKSSTTFNYIYIKNGKVYKSIYNEVTSSRSDTIMLGSVVDAASLFEKQSEPTDTLKIKIGTTDGNQDFVLQSTLKLVNLNLVIPKNVIQGSASDLAVKYKVAPLPTSFSYTISFNSAGGSSVPSISQVADTAVTAPADPIRTGYTFDGWSPAVPATMPVGGAELIAQWSLSPNWYTITFDSAGGSPVATITQEGGTTVTAPIDPTRSGYLFTEWIPTVPAIMPIGGAALTAQWAALSADATLESASVSLGELSPAFSPGTQSYAIINANKNASVTITVVKNDPKASLDRTSATVNKQNTTADFTVTAENGDKKVYRFVFGVLNDDASLSSVNLSKGTLQPAFSSTVYSYTVKGKASDDVTITPYSTDSFATVSPTSSTVNIGNHTASFIVTAQDGVTQETYTFTYAVMNSDATLSAINLSIGTLAPVFSSSVVSYTVKGSSSDNITVTPIKSDSTATISPISAVVNQTNPTAAFTVVSEDGTVKVYTVQFVLKSSDATLASIGLSKGFLLPGFDSATLAYTVKGNAIDSITVTPVCTDLNASIAPTSQTISNANKTASFVVTAEDGATKTYTVTFVLISSDATLLSIGLSTGTLVPGFNASVLNYTVKGKSTDSIAVTPVKNNAFAAVSPISAVISDGSQVAAFTVTAEDGTIKTYSVTFMLMSSDATLKSASVNSGNTMTPAFSPSITSYTVGSDQNITVTVVVNNSFATVAPSTSQVVKKNNPSSITFTVTAEDGTTKAYTFTHD